MSELRKKLKTRNLARLLFDRLNHDSRFNIKPWGYNFEFKLPEVAITFCDNPVVKNLMIEREEDGIELYLISFIESFKRHDSNWKNKTPIIELRINTTGDYATASICINALTLATPKWVRFPSKNARQLVEHKALKVVNSNREAYISDSKYIDYFELRINQEWFFQEQDEALKSYFNEGV